MLGIIVRDQGLLKGQTTITPEETNLLSKSTLI